MAEQGAKMVTAVQRPPLPALRPFIKLLWAADERKPDGLARIDRERLLPTGSMHLVFRLNESPIRIFESIDDPKGETFRRGVIGGLRAGFYVKDISESGRTVGALLQPGASKLLFGVGADELAERHTGIDEVWGQDANQLWGTLGELTGKFKKCSPISALRTPKRLSPFTKRLSERRKSFA